MGLLNTDRGALSQEKQEILDFFKARGEQCIKITRHGFSPHYSLNFECVVVSPTGKKEKVFIRLQKNPTLKHKTHCSL